MTMQSFFKRFDAFFSVYSNIELRVEYEHDFAQHLKLWMKYVIVNIRVHGGKIWKLYISVLILMVYFILQQENVNSI